MLSEEHVRGGDGQIILHQGAGSAEHVAKSIKEGVQGIKIAAPIKYALYLVVSRIIRRYPCGPRPLRHRSIWLSTRYTDSNERESSGLFRNNCTRLFSVENKG